MRKKRKYIKGYKPDYKYKSAVVGRFINYLMYDGKKSVAEKVMYGALDLIKKETGQEPVKVFEQALANISPMLEVTTRRIGGANYQVPREVRPERQFMLAARWLIEAARNKKGTMAKGLAEEVLLASKNDGAAIKKKLDTHRMAEANRAFAHFAR